MNIMNIQQVMKFAKYAALLAIGFKTSSLAYRLYKEYQLTKPFCYKLDYDLEVVWNDLVYDESNITIQQIRDIFEQALKVGSKVLISITEYMQKQRRFFGWKYTQYCVQNVIAEFNRKIQFSRDVIQQILSHKGHNYQTFDQVAFQGMQNNDELLRLNIHFEVQVFQQFAQGIEQLNKEGIYYYMDKFLEILTKNQEQIQLIKNIIINHNHVGLRQIIYQSYIHDIWYLSFGFEYQALDYSIQCQILLEDPMSLFNQRIENFIQSMDKNFE